MTKAVPAAVFADVTTVANPVLLVVVVLTGHMAGDAVAAVITMETGQADKAKTCMLAVLGVVALVSLRLQVVVSVVCLTHQLKKPIRSQRRWERVLVGKLGSIKELR